MTQDSAPEPTEPSDDEDHDESDDDIDASNGDDPSEVIVVGGGVAGLTAATFTARAGLETLVIDAGDSILARNAHLENVPGFPAGVNPRRFLDLLNSQATRNGAAVASGRVESLRRDPATEGFVVETAAGDRHRGAGVVAASWADASYLADLAATRDAGSKAYVDVNETGRTNVEGLYAAGRLAERYHQAVVAAGDGATAAITLIHDAGVPFYHDWVVPEGYFTDRGREVPPGCTEIGPAERRARWAESRATMRSRFAEPHDSVQLTHPSLVDDERGRVPEDRRSD
ncbi:MAG: FAD-dependent oxidoreductase [Halolamina sp.]